MSSPINGDDALKSRAAAIRLVITDIDGVWTDGGMYYGPTGECMKRFNTRDGAGVARLRDHGIPTVIVTREDSDIVRARARKLRIDDCRCGVTDKAALLNSICQDHGIDSNHVAYIGDDVYDVELLARVRLAACPADAMPAVRGSVDYVCHHKGGDGAFRELAELILSAQIPAGANAGADPNKE